MTAGPALNSQSAAQFQSLALSLSLTFSSIRQLVANLTAALPAPGLRTYCIYGTGVKTVAQLIYAQGQFPDEQPKAINGDGDGTVNRNSLELCTRWPNATAHPFPGSDHTAVL